MASVLNETGCSEKSIRRNPAAVLGRDSPFFGPDASPWATEIFLPVGGGVALPMTTLLGCYSGPRATGSLGLVEPKVRNDTSAFLCFDSHSSNRYCSFSRREKSASKGS